MTAKACPDKEFIELFTRLGGTKTAERLGVALRCVMVRRVRLERKVGPIYPPSAPHIQPKEYPGRICLNMEDGVVLIGSDAHYWPDEITPAHRAFCQFAKVLQPKVIIKNGDELDGASISRHPPIGWEGRPSLIQEMEAIRDRHTEIFKACKNARRIWSLGNHDARFETRLATMSPEYAKIQGIHLKDHFPEWEPCWSVWINDSVVIKHRFKGGVHATHNNAVYSGKTMVTGHLHSLKVAPFSDYNGTRYGVDCGTMADPFGPQFNYAEDNPRNWRSGFVVLTFRAGKLMWPEVVSVIDDNHVDFRGEVHTL